MGAFLVVVVIWLWWCLPVYLIYEDFRRHIPALGESRKKREDLILAPLLLVLGVILFLIGFRLILLVLPFDKTVACAYIYLMIVAAYLRFKEGPSKKTSRYGGVLLCLVAALMVFWFAFL